jgi:hypothetical protein
MLDQRQDSRCPLFSFISTSGYNFVITIRKKTLESEAGVLLLAVVIRKSVRQLTTTTNHFVP